MNKDYLVDQLADELSKCGSCGMQGTLVCSDDVSEETIKTFTMDRNVIYLHCSHCKEFTPVMGVNYDSHHIEDLNKDNLINKGTPRNAQYPCGSGKQFKRCCGKTT